MNDLPFHRLTPPIPDHRLDMSPRSEQSILHDRIQSALEQEETQLQQGNLADIVEQLQDVFPAQVGVYGDLQSKINEAKGSTDFIGKAEVVGDELKPFNTRLLSSWGELVSLGSINFRGLQAMVSGDTDLNPLMDSAIWPQGFSSMDYSYGSGSGDGFVGSAKHEEFLNTTLPLVRERVEALVASVSAWNIANGEALAYLTEALSEDQPIDLEQ